MYINFLQSATLTEFAQFETIRLGLAKLNK